MCFSSKIKTPSVDTKQIRAVDPAPLTEEPKGVLFGGDSDDDNDGESSSSKADGLTSEVSGRKSLKVKLDDSVEASKSANKQSTGTKATIRKSILNKR